MNKANCLYRQDRAGSYVESLTMSAAPHLTGGVPDGTEAIANVQTDHREGTNLAGQTVTVDDYFHRAGTVYENVRETLAHCWKSL